MQVAHFVNSGREANDMAVLLACLYTVNHDLIALRNTHCCQTRNSQVLC